MLFAVFCVFAGWRRRGEKTKGVLCEPSTERTEGMATYATYRHVELDNVGYGKKR